MNGLEPLTPLEAVESYITARKSELSQSTLYEHKTRLNRFTEWCEKVPLTDLNDHTPRKCRDYLQYRQEKIAPPTLENEMRTFRLAVNEWETKRSVPEVRFGVRSSGRRLWGYRPVSGT